MTWASFILSRLFVDGLRPELQALFDRLAIDPHSELFIRHDGMTQSGPDPVSEMGSAATVPIRLADRNTGWRWRIASIRDGCIRV